MPAKNLDEVYNYFQKHPIKNEEFRELYVDADKGRGGKPACNQLKRRLINSPSGSFKILFAGYRGCGKSTELLRLQRQIENDFAVLNFSVVKELDYLNMNYIELFIAVMERMFHFIQNDERIEIAPQYLENIKSWIKSVEIQEINEKYMGLDIEAGIKSGLKIPFFAEFFAKFKSAAKSSSSMKETLVVKVEPKLSELIMHCNSLIDEIKSNLHNINKKGLVIIIEDLDKVDLQKGQDIFYIHSAQLLQLNCHCIFTFPIALIYNINSKPTIDSFTEAFVLPMIKVREKSGSHFEQGIQVMQDIVGKRMSLSFFKDLQVLREMILYSGGCLRDLFKMIIDASDNALDHDRDIIEPEDVKSAYYSLKAEYEYTIADNKERDLTVDDYYSALKACVIDPNKIPSSSEALLDLRNNLAVLNYQNGDSWGDVHPVVKKILEERGLIDGKSKA